MKMKSKSITVPVTIEEFEWVAAAASLNGITVREYVVRAINQRLRSQGVDAILLAERCDQ